MLEKVKQMAARLDEIDRLIQDPKVLSAPDLYAKLMRERGGCEKFATRWRELERVQKQKAESEALLGDPDMKEIAQEDLDRLKAREEQVLKELEDLVLTADEQSSRSVIVEIRPGVGGEEAALFAQELLEMYTKYAARKGWKVQMLDVMHSDLGGLKHGNVSIDGDDVYKHLRYESGTHRVQRVPATEASGRIHTSTATVAVMPQAEDVEVEVVDKDLRIDTYSAGGPGGQHVNKTQSAVRLTHLPTGIVVQCQDQRSQTRNRELAMRWLRAKLYEHFEELKSKERRDLRRSQVGTGDRSEKIRTYHYKENRVTDHRIPVTLYRLQEVLLGDLDELIGHVLEFDKQQKLKAMSSKA